MPQRPDHDRLRLALPKGRMAEGVIALLDDAGIRVRTSAREYRPDISLPGFEVKILKPQSIVTMLQVESRDIGFTGADWITEFGVEAVELLDTGLDPVRLVAAAPHEFLTGGDLPQRSLIVASEFERITKSWIQERGLNATFLRSFGATEVYPPEDADCIVDIVATGATLQANGLQVFDELAKSSTRLYANPTVLKDPAFKERIDGFVMLLRSVLEARRRVMVEVNVDEANLERIIAVLPCMREPTVAPLHGQQGYAVKAAVRREELPSLIPRIKAHGGMDIVVSQLSQIVP
ncbi:MAG: ATP phosphoribosyltransferase [Planctomycetes bacterium]|nr:ATP phosphoribosyltransferase [Planctomycetota bacterium]MBI3835634.1 ATP phosphoribosyltransferase [Planctomycetota bacterium]